MKIQQPSRIKEIVDNVNAQLQNKNPAELWPFIIPTTDTTYSMFIEYLVSAVVNDCAELAEKAYFNEDCGVFKSGQPLSPEQIAIKIRASYGLGAILENLQEAEV